MSHVFSAKKKKKVSDSSAGDEHKGDEPARQDPRRGDGLDQGSLDVVQEFEDAFVEFFSDGSENVVVELHRLAPKLFQGIPCAGYVDNLLPGSSLASIKEAYGGGQYKLMKKVDFRYLKGGVRFLTIIGNPIVSTFAAPVHGSEKLEPVLIPAAPASSSGSGRIKVGDVELDLEDANFYRQVQRMMLLKSVLKEPDPLNSKLLEIVLNSNKPEDAFAQVQKMKDLIGVANELLPASGGGGDIVSLITQGLKTLGNYIDQKRTAAGPGVSLTEHLPAEIAPGKVPPAVEYFPEKQSDLPLGKDSAMDIGAKANQAVGIIATAFSLEPPMEINRVLALLESDVQLPGPLRVNVVPYRSVLFDKAELMLADLFADLPEKRAEFSDYFNAVFNAYCGVG